MNEDNLYYYYGEEEIKETPQEHLTRILYLRNFDTPKKIKEIKKIKDEIDVLRSAVEALAKGEKIREVGIHGTTSKKRKRVVLDTRSSRNS